MIAVGYVAGDNRDEQHQRIEAMASAVDAGLQIVVYDNSEELRRVLAPLLEAFRKADARKRCRPELLLIVKSLDHLPVDWNDPDDKLLEHVYTNRLAVVSLTEALRTLTLYSAAVVKLHQAT